MTRDNIAGSKRLAFELRNHGVDRVADAHFASDDAKEAANTRAIENSRRQITKEFEPQPILNIKERVIYTTRMADGPDGSKVFQNIKIVDSFRDGLLMGSVETVI